MAGPRNSHYVEDVYAVTQSIPPGRITTYGAIADFLTLGSARMVGWALNKVTPGDQVPAHRVVNRKGELSGRTHFKPPSAMQERLEAEGIVVVDDKVRDFKELFWSPTELLP
ncbi:cysteine methyltransferase [Lewinellaceae bacterium SD302]|nr:cysteine methyltransferase [Lewinellaceae bacterium SD302]